MHELGVVFHIADIVRDVAVENKATKIRKVVMQIGEVSTVVNDQLIDCWNWNANRTELLKGSVELRPNVWCCPKATRLVYLICEGIANAIE